MVGLCPVLRLFRIVGHLGWFPVALLLLPYAELISLPHGFWDQRLTWFEYLGIHFSRSFLPIIRVIVLTSRHNVIGFLAQLRYRSS